MVRWGMALAAGMFAMLGTAVTQLVELEFVESAVLHTALEALFVGATIYLGLKLLERSETPQ